MTVKAFGRIALFMVLLSTSPALAVDEVSEGALVSPSAQDILKQIGDIHGEIEKPDDALVLVFQTGQSDLSAFHKQEIEVLIVPRADQGRVKVEAFATAPKGGAITARMMSQERALKVRAFLQDQGVAAQMIDIFPMGDQMPVPVTDSVKIYISK